ncbi:porin [Hyphomicrobium sp.]|uniref:porin n=1 Tax=Hyphomicrobium sp. TaxID=82 RepID=UPI000FA6567A|nr:porin [Hyphomicrobium sp.]RUO97549.1 MAG: porin [Hyphomicrobium sp.]
MSRNVLAVIGAAGSLLIWNSSLAQAADLGGNCCADLEERIAELEATTARKGNRKVSLTVTGWVTEQVMWWDDGHEWNTYVIGLGTNYASNVQFVGSAEIAPGYSAGYVLHLELRDNNIYSINQNRADSTDANTVNANESYWYLKSDRYGRVAVGKQSPAGDNANFNSDLSGTQAAAYWVAYDTWDFGIRLSNGSFSNFTWGGGKNASGGQCHGWGGGPGDCVGSPRNEVRYDSPVIAGVQLVASWGEDDEWGVTGYYTANWGDFLVKGVASYSGTNDPNLVVANPAVADFQPSSHYLQLAGYLEHVPTGIWGNFQWGHMDSKGYESNDVYYAKAGIKLKLTSLGVTRPYGEYLRANNGIYDNDGNFAPGASQTFYGAGIAQDIDAAAMQVWLRARVLSADIPRSLTGGLSTDDFTEVVGGALISF